MAGIDGTKYRATMPENAARAYWEKHLRNDQTSYNDLEMRRYAQGRSDVKSVRRVKK
jgi:hypothetical protein